MNKSIYIYIRAGSKIIADGAYSGEEIRKAAEEAGITLVTTGLTGRKPDEILSEFQTDEDGKTVTQCPEGHKPKRSSYKKQTDSVMVSFNRDICANCPRLKECNPELKIKVAVKRVPIDIPAES